MITLQSKTRYAQNFELTLQCVCPELPAVTQTVAQSIVTQTGRAGPFNANINQNGGVIYNTDRVFAPSLTLQAREKRAGLPDAVADAPEVVAAAKAGLVLVVKEGVSMPVKTRSKDHGKSVA